MENIPEKWLPEIRKYQPKVPFIIVGTKMDLRDLRNDPVMIAELKRENDNIVTYAEGKELAEKLGAAAYVECSAKQNVGLKEVFDNVIHAVLEAAESKRKDKTNCVIQ